MNIVFAINKSYKDILSVLLLSILENNSQEFIHFYILNTDFDEKDKKNYDYLHKSFKNFEISFLKPDASKFKDLKLNIGYISIEAYYRYSIAELLSNEDRALYLDADTIVNGSLSELYHTDLGNNYMAGVRDLCIEELGYKEKIDMSENDLYINSGVLLLNLKKMRADNLEQTLLNNTNNLKDIIEIQDQDVINITCKGKIKEIDSIYNFTHANVSKEKKKHDRAVIIHYTGKIKAWDKDSINKMKNIWWKYKKIELQLLGKDLNDFPYKTSDIFLFHLPIITIMREFDSCSIKLFKSIPLYSIKCKKHACRHYLFGFIPFLKIKEK